MGRVGPTYLRFYSVYRHKRQGTQTLEYELAPNHYV